MINIFRRPNNNNRSRVALKVYWEEPQIIGETIGFLANEKDIILNSD